LITIFATPKKFQAHNGVIQRNALRSWTLLRPECEIILVGNDEGTAEAAEEFGVGHIPVVDRTSFGTPRVDSMFAHAESAAKYDVMCHLNADIILMNDFIEAVQQVTSRTNWFIMSGQRWNVDLTEPLEFGPGWEQQLRSVISQKGSLGVRTGFDYWVYSKGLLTDMPPFGVGRTSYDNWFLYRARLRGAHLVDATPAVMDVHQNHDYSHHAQGAQGVYQGEEHLLNWQLAGGRENLFIIKDRTHILTKTGLKSARDAWRLWRMVRTFRVLYPNSPLPIRMALSSINKGLDVLAYALRHLKLSQSNKGPQSVLKS